MSKSEWVGVAAIAALGYILLKKLEPVTSAAQSATNTVTTYVEKVTEKVEKVSSNLEIVKDTAEKYYTPSGIAYNLGSQAGQDISLTQAEKDKANTVLQNANTVNEYALIIQPAVKAAVDAALAYAQGAVDASKTSSNKYSSAAGSSKVDTVVSVNPLNVSTETSAFTLEMPDYTAAAGSGKSTSSGSSKTTTVKAGSGGYSAAQDKSTTVNAGKYETIKVK